MVPYVLFSVYKQMYYHSLSTTIGHLDELSFTRKSRRPIIQFLFINSANTELTCICFHIALSHNYFEFILQLYFLVFCKEEEKVQSITHIQTHVPTLVLVRYYFGRITIKKIVALGSA